MNRALPSLTITSSLGLLALVGACGGSTTTVPDEAAPQRIAPNDAAAPVMSFDSAAPLVDSIAPPALDATVSVPSCPAAPDGSLWDFESAASGSIEGPDVAATFCNAGASVFTNVNGTFLQIGSYGGLTTFDFGNPTVAEDPTLDVLLPVAASPGVYTSAAAVNCGSADFDYAVPPPPGLDCGDGGAPASPSECPAGCIAACSGLGCGPCAPNPPSFGYGASGNTGGICAEVYSQPGTLTGSWQIKLDSVVLFQGDAGGGSAGTPYVVHGTLSAETPGGGADGGVESATLSITF